MGTVIDEAAARYCEDMVSDAVAKGARLLAGHERRGALYAPTVIDHVPFDAPVVKHETRSEEHTSELQSLMRISYAVFCLKKKKSHKTPQDTEQLIDMNSSTTAKSKNNNTD